MVIKSERYRQNFYRNFYFLKQLIHASTTCKPYININARKYRQFSWQSYALWNRPSFYSQNEESCISERNLYRVETAVLSV